MYVHEPDHVKDAVAAAKSCLTAAIDTSHGVLAAEKILAMIDPSGSSAS